MPLSIAILLIFSFASSVHGKDLPKTNEIKLENGNLVVISVKNLKLTVKVPGKSLSFDCTNTSIVNFQFSKDLSISLTCSQAYGGIVRLHDPKVLDPRAGIVVGNDWADEGCFEKTSGSLEWTKDDKITVVTSTQYGGQMVDGNEKDCNPHKSEEKFVFNKGKMIFEKVANTKK